MASLRLSTSEAPRLMKTVANLARAADIASRPFSQYARRRNLHAQPLQSPQTRSNAGKYTSRVQHTPTYPSQLLTLGYHLKPAYSTTSTTSSAITLDISTEPTITPVFETVTGTFQYLVADPTSHQAAIIDPVLDYDPVTQNVTTASADNLLALTASRGYTVSWILETHAHADHLTAAGYLRRQLERVQGVRPKVGIGKRIGQVQERFGKRYGVPSGEYECAFDVLFDDDEEFAIGELKGCAMHLPGHTPDHLGYKIGDNVLCGDSLFHVDIGTARCDFPGGSTTALWQSAQKLLALPENVKIWTGHDYPPDGRSEPVPYMTVQQHRELNKHVKQGTREEEFVAMRTERDAKLAAPRLLHQSLQVNVRGGNLPAENAAGLRLLHLPLKVKEVW